MQATCLQCSGSLAEKIVGFGAKQIERAAASWLVRKPANDAGRCAVELAADQPGGASQFVGDGFQAGLQRVAVGIAAAAVVAQRFHPRDADAKVHEAFAPGSAKRVGDQNGDSEPGALLDFAIEFARRAVGIGGQQQGVA